MKKNSLFLLILFIGVSCTIIAQNPDFRSDLNKAHLNGKVKQLVLFEINETNQKAKILTRTYDESGYLTEEWNHENEKSISANATDYPSVVYTQVFYFEHGKPAQITEKNLKQEDIYQTIFQYIGNICMEKKYNMITGKQEECLRYTYNPDGTMKSVEKFSGENSEYSNKYDYKIEYEYVNGKLVHSETILQNGQKRLVCNYEGNMLQPIEYWKYGRTDGHLRAHGRYEYDSEGNQLRWFIMGDDGKWSLQEQAIYDNNGNLLKKKYSNERQWTEVHEYIYDEHANWIRHRFLYENVLMKEECREIDYYLRNEKD